MSAINTGSINVNYPIPGVNNSSQGFRDNFSGIKNNLDTAADEISDLQDLAILKGALPGTVLDNNMSNTLISNALTQSFRQTTYNLGNSLSGNLTVDLANGDIQYGTVVSNLSLGFTGWAPSNTYSVVELMLTVASPTTQILLPSAVSIGTSTLETYTASGPSGYVTVLGGSAGLDSPSMLHLIFSTKDCGVTVEVSCPNRPRRATRVVTTVPTAAIGVVGDRAGMIASDSTYLYVCTANYNGSTSIWKRITLAAW